MHVIGSGLFEVGQCGSLHPDMGGLSKRSDSFGWLPFSTRACFAYALSSGRITLSAVATAKAATAACFVLH